MARRWTYSQAQIYFDPQEKIAQLLKEKVPLEPEEKRWLMMSGLTLSEWYINQLTELWVGRGNLISAHQMFDQGLIYFSDMLFGLNDEWVAGYEVAILLRRETGTITRQFPGTDQGQYGSAFIFIGRVERRQKAFMGMWNEMKPMIEEEVQMSYDEIIQLV